MTHRMSSLKRLRKGPPGWAGPVGIYADEARLNERLAASVAAVGSMRDTYFAARFGAVPRDLEASADALAEIAAVMYAGGDAAGANDQLAEALRKAPQSAALHNNMGVALAALDSLDGAEDHFRTALALGGNDAGAWLNLGLTRRARGDSAEAAALLSRGIARAGGYEAACGLLALAPADPPDNAGAEDAATRDARRALKAAAAAAPARGATGNPPPARPGTDHYGRPPLAGWHRHLHWIE